MIFRKTVISVEVFVLIIYGYDSLAFDRITKFFLDLKSLHEFFVWILLFYLVVFDAGEEATDLMDLLN